MNRPIVNLVIEVSATLRLQVGRLLVAGVGASDYRVGCGSHLRFRRAR
jgi:hypothetical protein